MATAQYGAIITAMRGSIGGTTFSKGGSQQVVKNRAHPPRPMQPTQQLRKQMMAQFATTWRGLSAAVRADWATYAATCSFVNSLGQTFFLNGFQMFVRNSIALSSRGAVLAAAVPGASGKSTLPTFTFDYNATNLRLTGDTGYPGAPAEARGAVYQPVAQSVGSPRGRIVATWLYNAAGTPFTIAAGYGANLTAGVNYRAWIVLRYTDDMVRMGDEFFYPVDFTA